MSTNKLTSFLLLFLACLTSQWVHGEAISFGGLWPDDEGRHINAHGGCIINVGERYYWFGEHRPALGEKFQRGVTCYSSGDLKHWHYEGLAFSIDSTSQPPVDLGCTLERPKVVYCPQTKQYVLWFHLELKGRAYEAAQCATAVSDSITGPYRLLHTGRVCPGIYPENMPENDRAVTYDQESVKEWWTPQWYKAVRQGYFVQRDLEGGQMTRDMTIYVDDDGKAYHIYSSEENLTLQIAELSPDYQRHTGRYVRVAPTGQNEAPTLFKHNGTYWLITSGCTGWKPNEARMFSAPSIFGPWKQHPSPFRGKEAESTFGGQGTFVFQLPDGRFVFMADIWKPNDLANSEYFWLTIDFDDDGTPVINRQEQWSLPNSPQAKQKGKN